MSIQHIILRAKERYGLSLDERDIRYLLKLIGVGRAVRIELPLINNAQAWIVDVSGRSVVAVTVLKADGEYLLRTVLPAERANSTGFKLGDLLG